MTKPIESLIKIMDEENIDTLPANYRKLTSEDCSRWASKPYWSWKESILLSMSYNPDKRIKDDAESFSLEELLSRAEDYKFIADVINRNRETGSLSHFTVEKIICEETLESANVVVFCPAHFTKWAIKNLLSFPSELYEKVCRFTSNQDSCKPAAKNESAGGNAGSHAKWAIRQEIIDKAALYVKEALLKGCVYCDHCKLGEYMCNHLFDANGYLVFSYPAVKETLMLKYLQMGAKLALVEFPDRIVGNKGYKKSYGHCELHPTD